MKLYDKEVNPIHIRLGLEMIESQVGDKEMAKIQTLMDELVEYGTHYKNKLPSGINYFRFKHTRHIINELERRFTKRFGVSFKLVNADDMLAAVIPTPPLNDNVLGDGAETNYDIFSSMLNLGNCEDGECSHIKKPRGTKEIRDIQDVLLDEKSVVWHIWSSFNKMSKTLNADGVTVNNKKATIDGLPKDYTIFILVDFKLAINVYKLNSREMLAIMLHEIGHSYTYIEQSYRTVRETSVLLDTLRHEIGKGKSFTETMKIMYKKMDGKKDIEDKGTTRVFLEVLDLYMDKTKDLDMNNPHSGTDSEQVADMFATRFGYGGDLARGLELVIHNNYNIIRFIQSVVIATFLYIMLATLDIVAALSITIFVLVKILVIYFVYTRVLDIVVPHKYKRETYDRLRQRYNRIKLDIVRQIRASDLPKEIIREYVKEFNSIDKLVNKTDKDKRFTELLASTMPWNKGSVRRKLLEQTLEEMSENRLYVASGSLKAYL